jgi:hypothetical protein
MRVWQLDAITRSDPGLIVRVAASRPAWKRYESIYNKRRYHELVATRDRPVLDSLVEHDFALEVLEHFREVMYLSPGGRLRSYRFGPEDAELPVWVAFERYGGEVVEDAFEKGSRQADPPGPL